MAAPRPLPVPADLCLAEGRFRLGRHGRTYVVLDEAGRTVRRSTRDLDVALSTLSRVAREDREASMLGRACLCCAATFRSEGAHNRLCRRCSQAVGGVGKEFGR